MTAPRPNKMHLPLRTCFDKLDGPTLIMVAVALAAQSWENEADMLPMALRQLLVCGASVDK